MTHNELTKSLAKWRRRKEQRERQWQRYIEAERAAATVEQKARAHELAAYWSERRDQADAMVERRKAQIGARNGEVLDDRALDFLVREEGMIPYAYNDPKGYATFGVGHLLHRSPVNDNDRRKWGTPQNPKPRPFVMKVFQEDLDKYERAVRDAVAPKLKRHQFAACVSLCFNVGASSNGFPGSTVVKRLNAGDTVGAADAFLMWDNPSMLRPRRQRERRLFLTGRYS